RARRRGRNRARSRERPQAARGALRLGRPVALVSVRHRSSPRGAGRMISALVVDDEAPARSELRYLLSQHPDVEVVGEAGSAADADPLLRAGGYDVVF